jgi:sialate O-acetylesterase
MIALGRPRRHGAWAGPPALALALALVLWAVPLAAYAQAPPDAQGKEAKAAAKGAVRLKQPVAYRVYQRGHDDKADIPVEIEGLPEGAKVVAASLSNNPNQNGSTQLTVEDAKLVGVPTGGPYFLDVVFQVGAESHSIQVPNVFVGDLWVLAGQSNMQGVGDLIDVTPPHPKVTLLGMDGAWSQAREPLHWLVDSPDPVHSGDPATRAERSAQEHKTRTKGAGLGLPFAVAMVNATGVPVGLVATAHGGTSMAQWDPAKKDEGGKSLYGSMLRQVGLAGGKVKGVLWYQGESDTGNAETAAAYPKVFADFINAVRSDLGQLDLPFYYVQIGRFVREGEPTHWNAVQDAQRRLAEKVPNTAVVSVVDLELDDAIHVGTQGQKRAGQRLARIAQRELFGMPGATTPTFDRVNKGANNTLVVRFKGVNVGQEQPAGGGGFQQFGVRGGMGRGGLQARRPAGPRAAGLEPATHIAGFSIRKEDGTEIPMIFEAAVGKSPDTVVLKLTRPVPEKAFLWYGHGFDPYCNLTDSLDMAVPVFGPIPIE